MSKKKQIGYSLIVWETLKEYNEETKWYEPTKNKRVEVAQLLSEELSDNEEVKSMLLDRLFGYKDNIKEMLKNNEFTEIPDYHKESLEKDQKIADLETKLADLQEEQIAEMKEHQEAMELADKTITNLVEDNRASQEWYKKQLADTEAQNKRVLEKLELIVSANQELEQKLAESEKDRVMWQEMYKSADKQNKEICETDIYPLQEENQKLKQQLAEKEEQVRKTQEMYFETLKEYDELEDNFNNTNLELWAEKIINQDKISFCIEQLEKVKDYAQHIQGGLINYIDNQIKQLKEMK